MVAERAGLGIEVKNMKGDFSETERMLTADESFAAELAQSCDSQSSEREERQKSMAEELLAIHETIKLLNDDDALELLAMNELRWSSRTPSNSASNLMLISVALNGNR